MADEVHGRAGVKRCSFTSQQVNVGGAAGPRDHGSQPMSANREQFQCGEEVLEALLLGQSAEEEDGRDTIVGELKRYACLGRTRHGGVCGEVHQVWHDRGVASGEPLEALLAFRLGGAVHRRCPLKNTSAPEFEEQALSPGPASHAPVIEHAAKTDDDGHAKPMGQSRGLDVGGFPNPMKVQEIRLFEQSLQRSPSGGAEEAGSEAWQDDGGRCRGVVDPLGWQIRTRKAGQPRGVTPCAKDPDQRGHGIGRSAAAEVDMIEEVDDSHGREWALAVKVRRVGYERMCGFAGIADPSGLFDDAAAVVRRMAAMLLLRGPDDEGTWSDPSAGIALGFRRLAIQDLSAAGHQPMQSASRRFTLVFNGEVYNFLELRHHLELQGHRFKGGSDTEVMLAAFEAWGVRRAIERFNGMFAFAVWDAEAGTMTLVRDRLGVKPLYWGMVGPRADILAFGSELKAIDALPFPRAPIDRTALTMYVRFGYIPSPFSIREGVHKLQPGHVLTWHRATGRTDIEQWWSAKEAVERGAQDQIHDLAEARTRVEDCLRDAVRSRLVADVPVGAFLSGGIDSSLMVALAAQESPSRLRTFTIGFEDRQFNEAEHAARIARHLGTDHTELYVAPQDGLDVLPMLADVFDEPFADSSAIPTFIVSRLARKTVKVGLSGDGGDELFGGYERYRICADLERAFGWMPWRARRGVASVVRTRDGFGRIAQGVLASLGRAAGAARDSSVADRMGKFASIIEQPAVSDFYPAMASIIKGPHEFVIDARQSPTPMTDPMWRPHVNCRLTRMMHADIVSYLPEEILTKTDRLTMANSLEGRNPYCDYRLCELAFRIPVSMKIHHGVGKVILRDILARHVPREFNVGRKMGFGIPLGDWLRGPLEDWVETTLSERRLREDGLFDPQRVRALWAAHRDGRRQAQWELWVFLAFHAWMDRWNGPTTPTHE